MFTFEIGNANTFLLAASLAHARRQTVLEIANCTFSPPHLHPIGITERPRRPSVPTFCRYFHRVKENGKYKSTENAHTHNKMADRSNLSYRMIIQSFLRNSAGCSYIRKEQIKYPNHKAFIWIKTPWHVWKSLAKQKILFRIDSIRHCSMWTYGPVSIMLYLVESTLVDKHNERLKKGQGKIIPNNRTNELTFDLTRRGWFRFEIQLPHGYQNSTINQPLEKNNDLFFPIWVENHRTSLM